MVENSVSDADESENDEEEIEFKRKDDETPLRKRKKLLKVKLICNLDESLNPANYSR